MKETHLHEMTARPVFAPADRLAGSTRVMPLPYAITDSTGITDVLTGCSANSSEA